MINEYINRRYKFLEGVAHNIVCSKKKHSSNVKEDSSDLLSYTVEHICSNRDKYSVYSESQLEGTMVSFMRNQWSWSNCTSKKSFLKQQKFLNEGNPEISYDEPETAALNKVEMEAEDIP